ncbi:TRAPP trafficking subunit Trs65-domain-containing protein [Epithele typhae]|uniref:TRAPP trafficking subunit Trs65-domain-containing protein n=1 Tax=Epithele typhae TaxID=378194 RepID=UPI002008C50D|nr:TRAPP trafficking subunit Trs65-domain-containing protein [Epithele typhae]KAH9938827.1 TRAPP trafficking subunit Trs65-domain-containing protein [Epithele typhae]
MSSYEELFEGSVLEVIAPPPSFEFPANYSGDKAAEWLTHMREPIVDRKTAFFDENLDFLLAIRLPPPADQDLVNVIPLPPANLLGYLTHLQISYEAAYISPSSNAPDTNGGSRLSMPPPRNSSMQRNRPGALLAGGPSIFPPHTPHPIPSAAEADLKYVQSQGTPLVSAIWGEGEQKEKEAFALLWDAAERSWLAVYKMSILVVFMITKEPDPLLAMTVSTTLRNKPLAVTPPRRTLAALIDSIGGLRSVSDRLLSPTYTNGEQDDNSDSEDEDLIYGLQEVNLLEGLTTAPTFAEARKRLSMPTTRLGTSTRAHAFSLPPLPNAPSADTPVPYSSTTAESSMGSSLPRGTTLRKSFRKTLKMHQGFRVRMRTVFVPYFLLPQDPQNGKTSKPRATPRPSGDSDKSDSDSDIDDDILEEREQREAGNEEHTVVLSVEVENLFASSASPSYHFEVERLDVAISGSGARASFIGWGSYGADVFPLQVGPREQVNLLYAVSFLRGPDTDEFSLARPPGLDKKSGPGEELQRAVTIHLIVRPFEEVEAKPFFPTEVYPSRWNCVLDLASSSISKQKRQSAQIEVEDEDNQEYFVLPTPASPFPTAPLVPPQRTLTPLTVKSVIPLTAVAGSKRHTFSAFGETPAAEYARRSPMNYASPTAMLNPQNQPPAPPNSSPTPTGQTLPMPHRASYIPPSVAFQSSFQRSPTTYNAPSPPLPPPPHALGGFAAQLLSPDVSGFGSGTALAFSPDTSVPRTPAYPAYPSSPAPAPTTPFWQAPISHQSGPAVEPSVDIRRSRGGSVPQTPGPTVGGFGTLTNPIGMAVAADGPLTLSGGEPVVVSVGLHLGPVRKGQKGKHAHGTGELYPLETFTLDIFVFNQSSWTRRFEVTFPEERRRRRRRRAKKDREREREAGGKDEGRPPGIVPLENRVRIGPLLPSTCQSVRMDFLALAPGVHSIDTLVLTDVQTNYQMHLSRNALDIIVHEPHREES